MDETKLKELLGQHGKHSYYDELFEFFNEIYIKYKEGKNCRIVILTKTCYKLFNIWISLQNRIDHKELKLFCDKCIFTLEEFIVETKYIVDEYHESNKLPRIVLVDWSICHAIKINKVLFQYENAFLETSVDIDEAKEYFFRDRIAHLVEIHIFARSSEKTTMLFSRYRFRYSSKLELSEVEMHEFQLSILNILQELLQNNYIIKDVKTEIENTYNAEEEKELDFIINKALLYISYKMEQEEYMRIQSGIYFGEESIMKLEPTYTLEEFIAVCQEFNQQNINLEPNVIAKILFLREQQGYISLSRDSNKEMQITFNKEILLMKLIEYIDYIRFLAEVSRRSRESQLDLKKELFRAMDYISTEEFTFTKDELYQFLLYLKSIGQPIESYLVNVGKVFPNAASDEVLKHGHKSMYLYWKYREF